ncbi:MAG: hypothetical protein MJ211_04735 [Bacteroidales bacterium]|nr:hypothetical protein [Bacteroidales bacterium]
MLKLCSFIEISPLTKKETDLAFKTKNPDFEDALQYFSAMSVDCDYIITRDPKHFKYSTKPVMSGEEFLNLYNENL